MALSKTFACSDQPSILDPIAGYASWSTNRGGSDKGGGGLTILYKDTLTAHKYTPAVPTNLEYIQNERQWLLVNQGKDRCAFLHVYIACQSFTSDSFLKWNEDLFLLIKEEAIKLKQQGFLVLAMGDFNSRVGCLKGLEGNTPDHNKNTPMFLTFLREVNLLIINTLPVAKGLFTRFMDSSGRPGTMSLLDYGLIDHDSANTVTSFVIDEAARTECGSDHAVLECILMFSERPKVDWSFHEPVHYDIKGGSSFTEYQNNLDLVLSSMTISQFTEQPTSQMLAHVSDSINESAMKTFGLKISKIKRGRKLPRPIIALIRAKNELARKLSLRPSLLTQAQLQDQQEELLTMKTQIKDNLSSLKLRRRCHLRSKLLLADPNRKKFWRFLKGQIKTAGQITALNNIKGEMVFEQHQVEDVAMQHFATIFEGKRIPIYPQASPPDQIELALHELDQILGHKQTLFEPDHFKAKVCAPYSFVELSQILEKLPSGKACGYDRYTSLFILKIM